MHVSNLNPDLEIDPMDIDESLEFDEALNDLKEKYPQLMTHRQNEPTEIKQARELLCDDFQICHKGVQNLILEDTKPFSEGELVNVGFVLSTRPEQAWLTDRALRAPNTRDVRKWAKNPNRTDIRGLDSRLREPLSR